MTEHIISSDEEEEKGITSVSITDEMQNSYLTYAINVILGRAIPDLRDGLKPVHRRILFGMMQMGVEWNKKYVKCARISGEVMGKYHPHGNAAIYDALARMAQDWSLRLLLIEGQGNFGSVDGDPPAAERYTECRLQKAAHFLLDDLGKDTVDFRPNYDGSFQEPVVLCARYPNVLVNGGGGIAVGMATNIPTHNLGEVVDGCVAVIDNPDIDLDALMEIIRGPDFPTGAVILGRTGIKNAYATGRGSIVIRGVSHIEKTSGDREQIVVTEIPYQVNKAAMLEKIAELVREKRIVDIADLRDESDRQGYRVVIELKRGASADVILNQLYRYTSLQSLFSVNMVALNGYKPERFTLIGILKAFVAFREEVVVRRTKYLLNKARDRAHVLVGLAIAVANLDEVVRIIRFSPNPETARRELMQRSWNASDIKDLIDLIDDSSYTIGSDGTMYLSEVQTRAILELRLARLTGLGRDDIRNELNSLGIEIKECLDILSSRSRLLGIIKQELLSVKDELDTPRRTRIVEGLLDMEDEDCIVREDMVVTVSHLGYVKRVPLSVYRAQRRGGKGRSGVVMRDEDFVTDLFIVSTHTSVLFFSSLGFVYKEKVWRLPIGSPQARGKALINILSLNQGERITTIMPFPEDESSWNNLYVVFATKHGNVRRNKLSDFIQINRSGKIAMKLDSRDEILSVETCTQENDILLTTKLGQCVRFPISAIRVFAGRNSVGVRGISLAKGDQVISMAIVLHADADYDERICYMKHMSAQRRLISGDTEEITSLKNDSSVEGNISEERCQELKLKEQFILTVSEKGFGKRTSSYDFRISNRSGKGIRATDVSKINEIGALVAVFPVNDNDQIILVSDKGTLIRVPVNEIRIASRATKGVVIFSTAKDERVVSVERIRESEIVDEAESTE
ncbi:DNA gyrase subunit A [Candidatus Liberibacter asiaticus]|uniref:DNA gyrase subunit A n=2 Tax=Liberibacter asiaticus TaxID=34021 RepID=C6XHB2_LIBAP|nr:DNA gyrase subunit A [Candidatus Liberibacter asiaticus]AGH16422.1 DNA gyrase subunit A [Candidatus Liberibacter asiaticus str. gxpsy]ACT56655.1 DNA gyrase subunit A [Candidatus Liberibacter asiaticus str. psy62]ALK06835.1 DNA gyrase subunit A [Candidatus Liberibacter asiaticus]ASK52303.1 DNA gyrase subunit A [Candidatus Liberibacter asiaticus]AWL13625.1 DNA gyrase subunit A [Candidatus Liberibacter asiaticus]